MNVKSMLQAKAVWSQINQTHPKLLPFLKAVEADGIKPGSIIEIVVTTPEGVTRTANIKVQPSDVELLNRIRNEQ